MLSEKHSKVFPVSEEDQLINREKKANLENHHFAIPSVIINSGRGQEWMLKLPSVPNIY